MAKTKVAITVDERLLTELDALVARGRYANRSQGLETALCEHLDRERRGRLSRECAKLDVTEERRFAEEGLASTLEEWPEY